MCISRQKMKWLTAFVFKILLLQALGFENLSENKHAAQSSTYSDNSSASKAVDGNLDQNWPNIATTEFGHLAVWWYVDLGATRNIHNVTIYIRTESFPEAFRNRFAGSSLYISNANFTSKGGNKCEFNSSYPPNIIPIVCISVGRYVTIYNERSTHSAMLDLAEVQVFGCPNASTYGSDCNMTCSNRCRDSLCNILNGSCFSCIAGYQGHNCQKPCSAGKYGEDCKNNCSSNCVNPMSCNIVNGTCTGGCNPGFAGDKCDQICEDLKYGTDCLNSCGNCQVQPCNNVNGSCAACATGYYPPFCQMRCNAGLYGQNCLQECSWNCKNNDTCNYDSGYCTQGCVAGWTNALCSAKCPNGFYGSDCVLRCSDNCKNGRICHHVTGICEQGCKDGYYGLQCSQTCSGICKNNAVCDGLTGACNAGCAAGWKSDKCNKSCDPGEFGENCVFTCGNCKNVTACNIITGLCEDGCRPGYSGLLCSTMCASGFYGQDCLNNCSGNCFKSETCNFKTGTCDEGCTAGYTGSKCNEICDEGKYGPECLSICGYCKGRKICNKKNGHCEECVAGFKPPLCLTLSQESSGAQDSQLGVGIAIGIGIVVALIIAALLGRLAFRRCHNATDTPKSTKEPDVVYLNNVMSTDQLNDSVKNDDYQELRQISDDSPQYDVVSPSAK